MQADFPQTISVRSNIFTTFSAQYSPAQKRAWLYRLDDSTYMIVADRGMEQAPTPQQVTNWVVDYLNGRLNEELAKLAKMA